MSLVQTFRSYVQDATPGQVETAAKWYLDAERVAEKVSENLGIALENGASVVSSFSPRERWTTNVAKAVAFSLGEEVTGLSNNLKMAKASIVLGFEALRGRKTNAFARAIAGDEQAVVVDVWMMRASGIGVDNPNKTQYTDISEAITTVASEFGLTPRTTQALIWIMVRGSAD
jgi:thermostable 8-oxoguanine DNA glycosylase